MQPLDATISGMIRTALAVRCGAGMQRFRKCMSEEVASRLEILNGAPPLSAVAYKRKLLQIFVRHGASVATKRLLLWLAPNGDWRSSRVQFYKRRDGRGPVDRAAVVEYVSLGLLVALASSQPSLYPRHQWCGADIAVDELAIMEGVHRILSTHVSDLRQATCLGR